MLCHSDNSIANGYNATNERDILKNIRQIRNSISDFDAMGAEIEHISNLFKASEEASSL